MLAINTTAGTQHVGERTSRKHRSNCVGHLGSSFLRAAGKPACLGGCQQQAGNQPSVAGGRHVSSTIITVLGAVTLIVLAVFRTFCYLSVLVARCIGAFSRRLSCAGVSSRQAGINEQLSHTWRRQRTCVRLQARASLWWLRGRLGLGVVAGDNQVTEVRSLLPGDTS